MLNFFTGYVRDIDATLITDRGQIASNYLRGWFAIDALGSVPWTIIGLLTQGGDMDNAGGTQIIKILKVPKLLRLGRLLKVLAALVEGAANLGRIVMLILMLALLIHWLASAFYLIAAVPAHHGGQSWMARRVCDQPESFFYPIPSDGSAVLTSPPEVLAFACAPSVPSELNHFAVYVATYYYTLLMLMGDDVDPSSAAEYSFIVLVVLIGACVNATIFANVASLVAQLTAPSAAHQAKVDSIDRAMKQLSIDSTTVKRIRGYYHYRWTRHRDHAGDHFIHELPYQLRTRTSCMVHEGMIRTCPLFATSERKFIAALSTVLVPEVYLPAQFIVIAGYVSRSMYFIQRGRVQIIRKKDDDFYMEECHDFFDVLGLFTERQHTISVRSMTHTDLYKLPRDEFENIVKDYPSQGMAIADAAHTYLRPMHASLAAQRIYTLAGMPNLLKTFNERLKSRRVDRIAGWRGHFQFRGVASKIRRVYDDKISDPQLYEASLQMHRSQIASFIRRSEHGPSAHSALQPPFVASSNGYGRDTIDLNNESFGASKAGSGFSLDGMLRPAATSADDGAAGAAVFSNAPKHRVVVSRFDTPEAAGGESRQNSRNVEALDRRRPNKRSVVSAFQGLRSTQSAFQTEGGVGGSVLARAGAPASDAAEKDVQRSGSQPPVACAPRAAATSAFSRRMSSLPVRRGSSTSIYEANRPNPGQITVLRGRSSSISVFDNSERDDTSALAHQLPSGVLGGSGLLARAAAAAAGDGAKVGDDASDGYWAGGHSRGVQPAPERDRCRASCSVRRGKRDNSDDDSNPLGPLGALASFFRGTSAQDVDDKDSAGGGTRAGGGHRSIGTLAETVRRRSLMPAKRVSCGNAAGGSESPAQHVPVGRSAARSSVAFMDTALLPGKDGSFIPVTNNGDGTVIIHSGAKTLNPNRSNSPARPQRSSCQSGAVANMAGARSGDRGEADEGAMGALMAKQRELESSLTATSQQQQLTHELMLASFEQLTQQVARLNEKQNTSTEHAAQSNPQKRGTGIQSLFQGTNNSDEAMSA